MPDKQNGRPAFRRVLLKLSGEALMGDKEYGLDLHEVEKIAGEIAELQEREVEVAIVVGAGNIYRGMTAAAEEMDRATADYAGMLATVLNALALQDVLERRGLPHASCRRSRSRRSPSRTSAGGRSAISRRAASMSSRRATAVLHHRHGRRPPRPRDRR